MLLPFFMFIQFLLIAGKEGADWMLSIVSSFQKVRPLSCRPVAYIPEAFYQKSPVPFAWALSSVGAV